MKATTLGLSAMTILAGALIACGGGGEKATPTAAAKTTATPVATTPAPTPTATPTATPAPSSVALTAIEENENKYLYDPAKLTVKAGEITVKLSNKAGQQRPHTFAVKSLTAGGTDIIRSERVQPGASLDVKFTIAEPGTYTFYCILQGHEAKGQTGTLTVVKG